MTPPRAGREFVASERVALCETLARTGPDGPTLCEGWQTRDLLLHLISREARTPMTLLRAAPGTVASGAVRGGADGAWPDLIERFRAGPPPGSPFRIPGVGALANTEEFFVHHEDVRRGGGEWARRELPPDVEDALFRRLKSPLGRLLLRHCDVGVHIRRTDSGAHATLRAARPGVVITGLPSEILLYAFGRRAAAEVRLDGPTDAVERLGRAKLGF